MTHDRIMLVACACTVLWLLYRVHGIEGYSGAVAIPDEWDRAKREGGG